MDVNPRPDTTPSGIPILDLDDPGVLTALGYLPNEIGIPGQAPFRRGIHPTMYRGRLWTMRQYAGFGSATATNQRFRMLLERGQMGLSIAFDLPTQIGLDSTDPLAEGEVGRVGVAIDTVEDMHRLLDGIDLDQVSTSMTINAPAMILLAMYVVVAEERDIAVESLRGTIQNDILKEYVARGTHIFPPAPSMRLIADTLLWCAAEAPKWNPISISGYHIREAGATAIEELGLTMSNAIAYVEAGLAAGLSIDEFAPRISFFLNGQNDFFEEIAKFRAARVLWHDIMKQRFGAMNPKSMKFRFHTQVAGAALTAQQPLNNITRVTIQALAAVLGGTQSLHTNSFDEAHGLPTEESATVALRTQQIIAEESGVANVVDPLAGSVWVEHLTDAILDGTRLIIEEIDSLGGAVSAIEQGHPQRMIHDSAWRMLNELEEGKRRVIGVNHSVMEETVNPAPQAIDSTIAIEQARHIDEVLDSRDDERVKKALAEIERVCRNEEEQIMPAVLEAVRERATIGEIAGQMREIWGDYDPPAGL